MVFNGAEYAMRIEGTPGNDQLIGGGENDTLVGLAGNDKLVGGGGDDQLWGFTDGWAGHPPPTWDNGADMFVFQTNAGRAVDGNDTLHITDPAHDDTLLLADPTGTVGGLDGLDSQVTVANGNAGSFDTQGDVTINWKDGSGSITLDDFFNTSNPVAEVHSLADLSEHLKIAVASDWHQV
jgi:Ca2+-binding RTX toxin-like protein